LYIGEGENFTEVQEHSPLIKKYLKDISHQEGTDSFMVNYAYLSALIELGFAPSLITGEKAGLWLCLSFFFLGHPWTPIIDR
jgi:hypothetical protein